MCSILLLLSLTAAIFAQTPTASLVGRITDSSGAVVPGVAIKVTNLDTNLAQAGKANEVGDYTIPFLQPGRYIMEATTPGFLTYRHSEFTLEVGQSQRIDIALQVGAASESVTITDTLPVLNTESGARGEVTTNEEIAQMPLDGRNFSDLAYLTGGVIPKGDGGDGAYAVNGARADNFGFVIDGVENTQKRNTGAMINPPLEGVQEFKLITSGFAAEYGRYAGGVLSVVTKSGGNRVHGSLYEFLRNDVFDATGYFDGTKSKLRRHQFGANISGPVRIPKIYNGTNRTFFMFTWDDYRVLNGKSQRGIVPLPEYFQGDFSKATDAFGKPLKLVDPLNKNAAFPNNQIPVSRFDPVAVNLAHYYPAPNVFGNVNNFISQGNGSTNNKGFTAKIDHQLSLNDRLTVSAFWAPNSSLDPVAASRSPLPIFGSVNDTFNLLSYIRYLRTFTPTMFLDLKASFSRKTNNQRWPYLDSQDWAATGFTGGITNPVAAGPPELTASGYIMLGPAYDLPKIWSYNNYQYTGALTWIKGKHSMKFGAEFLRIQYFSRQYGDTRGRLTFLGRNTGEPFADLLLGWPSSTRRQLDAGGPYHLVSNYAAYAQDDYKVSSNLTLNLGLRYELQKPPMEKYGAWSMFIPELGKQVIAGYGNLSPDAFKQRIAASGLGNYTVMASDVGLPSTIVSPQYTNFGPRFGFAWRPLGNHTVIRGGYGIFFGSSSLYRLDGYSDTYPFSITETYSAVTNNPAALTVSNPFPAARRGVSGTNSSSGGPLNPKAQYLQSYSMTLEREFGRGTVVEVAYSGSKGTHLQRYYDINQQGRDQANRNTRPIPGFAGINITCDCSNSIYSAGSVTVRRRVSKQMFIRGAYTYAKSIDESSNTGGTIQYNFPTAQDSRNLAGERGRSDFDIGHSFAGGFTWEPSFSRNVLAKGWLLAGTSTIYSGPPFTPKVANFNYTNGEASRPDRIRKGTLDSPTIDQWFDRTAFPVVPVGSYRFGSSGRNVLDGPGTFIVNLSVSRKFRIMEFGSMQLRLETFNTPNHPNFNLPENRVDIISGGTITRAKGNRSMQLGARFEF